MLISFIVIPHCLGRRLFLFLTFGMAFSAKRIEGNPMGVDWGSKEDVTFSKAAVLETDSGAMETMADFLIVKHWHSASEGFLVLGMKN